jgi:hypothetical protein
MFLVADQFTVADLNVLLVVADQCFTVVDQCFLVADQCFIVADCRC